MKIRILLACFLAVCILSFTGCACEHEWTEPNCTNAKTCSLCQETEGDPLGHDWDTATCEAAQTCSRCGEIEGEPLGHTPGDWAETADAITCVVSREQHCTVCNVLTGSEEAPLDTLIRDNLFLFTPQEFMDRMTLIAEQHSDTFSYELLSGYTGVQALVDYNGKPSIIQFFRDNVTALTEADEEGAWCVSFIAIGEGDADIRLYFLMACDPTLDKDGATAVDTLLADEYLNAASRGEALGFYQQNQLLYEEAYISEEVLGQGYSMNMVNVYASDYR